MTHKCEKVVAIDNIGRLSLRYLTFNFQYQEIHMQVGSVHSKQRAKVLKITHALREGDDAVASNHLDRFVQVPSVHLCKTSMVNNVSNALQTGSCRGRRSTAHSRSMGWRRSVRKSARDYGGSTSRVESVQPNLSRA